ncbi:MAG: class GN sortase [Casimicrobiaceae bacterium]
MAAARGNARASRPAESSPIGGAAATTARTRAIAIVALALALAGVAALGSGSYIYAKALAGQALLQWAWSRGAAPGKPVKPWPWADTHPVARLRVPALDVDEFVLAGASGRTLAWGPGHLDDSAPPGTAGNTVLSAHRDTHFRFLQRMVPGDAIELEMPGGARQHYRVRDVFIADVHSLRIPRDTPVPTLTLVTCYPFDALAPGGPLRYVVVAEAAGAPRAAT